MMWCNDPDKAFDISCRNLGCEDWCKDNSNCPISGKDQTMYITVRKNIDMEILDDSQVVIDIHKEGKKFSVLKHQGFKPAEGQEYHISMLKHILTAETK